MSPAAGRLLPFGGVLLELADVLKAQRERTKQLERQRGEIIPYRRAHGRDQAIKGRLVSLRK